jgi:hypothetical protein
MSEIDAISQLFNNINEKNNSNKKSEKCNINKKKCCIAAVKISTIGRAFKNILEDVSVYLVKDKKNNIFKTNAYIRCSKTIEENCEYCHLHSKVLKTNPEGIQDFEKDIISKGWLANVNDDYFINMGKRGAKKKSNKNTFTFNNSNNPILLILIHKNPKLTIDLTMYAHQILKGNDGISYNTQYNELKSDKKSKPSKNNLDNLFSVISEIDLNSNNKLSNREIEKINLMKHKLSDDNDESEDNDELDEEEEYNKDEDIINNEEVSCDEIYTTKNKLLWYNEENNTVYEPEGEDGGEEIGILKEIHIDHHTILHNDKFYTVLKEIFEKKHGRIYYCSLTNKLFNRDLEYIGNQKRLKNNEYQMIFLNEI